MNKLNSLKNTKLGPLSLGQVIFWVIVLALAVSGFFFLRNIVTCWRITPLPGMPPSSCGTVTAGVNGPVLNEQGTPVATSIAPPPPVVGIPESDLPPAWDWRVASMSL